MINGSYFNAASVCLRGVRNFGVFGVSGSIMMRLSETGGSGIDRKGFDEGFVGN